MVRCSSLGRTAGPMTSCTDPRQDESKNGRRGGASQPTDARHLLSAHSRNHIHRHRLTPGRHRTTRDAAFRVWRGVAGVASRSEIPISRKLPTMPDC